MPFVCPIVNGVCFPPICGTFFFLFVFKDTLKDKSFYHTKYETLIVLRVSCRGRLLGFLSQRC